MRSEQEADLEADLWDAVSGRREDKASQRARDTGTGVTFPPHRHEPAVGIPGERQTSTPVSLGSLWG